MKLVELHTKADQLSGSYYLGYLVYQSADAATLISLDDDANAGGVLVINNQDIDQRRRIPQPGLLPARSMKASRPTPSPSCPSTRSSEDAFDQP